jgi:hypothetical protein
VQIRRKDTPPPPDLVSPLLPMARQRRDRHPPGVEVLAAEKVDLTQARRRVLVVEGLRNLHIHVRLVPLLFGQWPLLL